MFCELAKTKTLVLRPWFYDPGSKILVPRSWYQDLKLMIQDNRPGNQRSLNSSVWCSIILQEAHLLGNDFLISKNLFAEHVEAQIL